jgi:hypothetical protein
MNDMVLEDAAQPLAPPIVSDALNTESLLKSIHTCVYLGSKKVAPAVKV